MTVQIAGKVVAKQGTLTHLLSKTDTRGKAEHKSADRKAKGVFHAYTSASLHHCTSNQVLQNKVVPLARQCMVNIHSFAARVAGGV